MPTTLVLGAGASIALGYPVGAQLRNSILSLARPEEIEFPIRAGLFSDQPHFHRFIDSFAKSQMNSIDSFLARRPEFSEIGKRTIAAILLECEKEPLLYQTNHPDHWYQYLFNKFATESWEWLDFSNLSIITFNYDRSLEHYLLSAIQASYGKSQQEALTKLATLEIVHVYGSLGAPLPNDASYISYGDGVNQARVISAANSLKVIPEGRDNDSTLQKARQLLLQARRIAFLGFGFDETNLNRLQTIETCARKIKYEEQTRFRNIIATCYGMTGAEANKAFKNIGQENDHYDNSRKFPRGFYSSSCLDMLRETLILDQ